MNNIIAIMHVLTAILFLGPVTVAVSTFQTRALAAHNGDDTARGSTATLHKITKTYGLLSLAVPLLGMGLLIAMPGYLREGRFHASILLSVIAWALLFFLIIPKQSRMVHALGIADKGDDPIADVAVEGLDWDKSKKQLSMFGGIFSLLWVIVFVLMML